MKHPLALALLAVASPAFALGPNDIVIVANKNVADSRAVAEHYCKMRGVPKANIIYLDLPGNDDISRSSYDTNVVKPLKAALTAKKDKVKLLLTVYGVPLRVGPTAPSADEAAAAAKLQPQIDDLTKQRDAAYKQITEKSAAKDPDVAKEVAALKAKHRTLASQVSGKQAAMRRLKHGESVAALDSELAGLWADVKDYRGYRTNPMYFRITAAQAKNYAPTLMTCRLDGPTAAIAKGLVDKALAAEAKGLAGKAYFDARGIKYDSKSGTSGGGYAGYDESVREAAKMFQAAKVATTLDDKPELFAVDSCPDCAIYCGWYSHAKYIASNKFVTGAVAYHIASSEMVSLRKKGATYWCKGMLEDGVTATIGPVAEPYTIGFPKPAEFYGFLGSGETLAESYWKSNQWVSWMMVLDGDPLYRPFAKAPLWKADAVKPSPAAR